VLLPQDVGLHFASLTVPLLAVHHCKKELCYLSECMIQLIIQVQQHLPVDSTQEAILGIFVRQYTNDFERIICEAMLFNKQRSQENANGLNYQ
jgi:hypothetical protein